MSFDELNDTFNTSGDVIKPEVVEVKLKKIKEGVMTLKKITIIPEVIFIP